MSVRSRLRTKVLLGAIALALVGTVSNPAAMTNSVAAEESSLEAPSLEAPSSEEIILEEPILEDSSLEGPTWQLISYGDHSVITGTDITATFANGKVTGSDGCNRYFGDYHFPEGEIAINIKGKTRRFCAEPEGTALQEIEYIELLLQAETYEISGQQLTIYTPAGDLIYSLQVAGD